MADWTNFPIRYTLYENAFGTNAFGTNSASISTNSFTTNTVYSWQELETTFGVSSQLWYATRERNVAGNENQDGGHSWNETHPYLYEIATSNVTYTDGASWTNSTTNTWLVYSNSVKSYAVDGYPIGDNELGSYEITTAVWTNSLWLHPPVSYSEMAAGVFSVWNDVDTADDAPYEFYVEWHLSTNDSVTLNEYFGTLGEPSSNVFAYPGIPYQTRQGAWARHMLGYRTNSIVTTNAWGLITDNGTSDAWGSGVSVIPMPLKLAEVRWVPDLYLDGYPSFGGSYEGAYVWSEEDQGWNRDSAFFRIVGFYTNGVWKYVGLETGAGAHVFVGDQLGISNAWTATDAYTNITGDTASMIVSETNTGVWAFHNIQPLFDTTAGFLRPYAGSPEVVYSGYTNAAVVTIQGTILTNWNNNPFEFDTSAEETATVTGGTNETKFAITGADAWRVITNMTVDVDGIKGDSISVTYYSPTNYYLWTTPNYNGRKGSTDQLDEMFRSLNALQWSAMNLNGNLAITSSVPANVGQWTWEGFGWGGAEANVTTNFTDYTDVAGIGAVVVTSPDPNWEVTLLPQNLKAKSSYLQRFIAPTNEYRMGGWEYLFGSELGGTLTITNSDTFDTRVANWTVKLGSASETGQVSIAASSSEEITWGILTNSIQDHAFNTNDVASCGVIDAIVTGANVFYYDSTITHTANSFLEAWVWARRWSASVGPRLAHQV